MTTSWLFDPVCHMHCRNYKGGLCEHQRLKMFQQTWVFNTPVYPRPFAGLLGFQRPVNENKLFGSMRTMSPKASASPEEKAQGKADSSHRDGNTTDTDWDARYCPVFVFGQLMVSMSSFKNFWKAESILKRVGSISFKPPPDFFKCSQSSTHFWWISRDPTVSWFVMRV